MPTKKPAKKTTKKAPAKAKLEQRPVTLSAPRPKKSLAPTLSTALPSKAGVKKTTPKKKKTKPKVKVESRPVTLSAPRPKKPARKPTAEPQPATIAPARGGAPAPYYPDYEPKGEWCDFAPMAMYFDEAASIQDLRERMLFRKTLGNHPEDVLVAGVRKARAMGWCLDSIEVEQPVAASTIEPASEPSAGAPEEVTTSTSEPEQPREAASEHPLEAVSETAAIESESPQPEVVAAEPAQPEATTPEPVLTVTVPERQEEAAS